MSSRRVWIAFCLLSVMTCDTGVYGRVLSQWTKHGKPALRTDVLKRWRRGATEAHRERCAELHAPWLENTRAPRDEETVMQLRVRPFLPGVSHVSVFPGKSLFSFIRRVYRCCQQGVKCRSVKGIQGRVEGDADVEFLVSREISALTVTSAELHLQLSNPLHINIRPVLPFMVKRSLPTRYSSWTQGDAVELRVDLQFLFKSLQEATGGATSWGPSLVNMRWVASPRGSPLREKPHTLQDTDVTGDGMQSPLELGLVLDCGQSGSGESCRSSGVHLTHAPFLTLYYK